MGHPSSEPGERDATAAHRDPLLGTLLNRQFRIVERIAAGGFGAIYRARHLDSGCDVAIKVLLPELASNANLVERFRREGAMLATLCSPHTVRTFEFGETDDGTLYIVMELLRGESLFDRFRARGPLPWSRATTIARAICSALAEAHARGIVHRDLKPANIFLVPHAGDDFVKVLDFGIAKIVTPHAEGGDLTQIGQMIGTSEYMSPEQILGGTADGRSDLYTLGVLIYELVTGRRPFAEATSATALIVALLTQTPPSPARFARIPPFLEWIVMKCLARDAEDRFTGVTELAAALDHLHATHAASHTERVAPLPQAAATVGLARHRMARGSKHVVPGTPAPPVPLAPLAYDLDHLRHRDTVVRRIVWGLVLAVGTAIALGAAHVL